MTKQTGLKSPAKTGEGEEDEIESDLKNLDPDFLDSDEIGEIPESAESTPHPFAGYPLGRKVKIGSGEVSSTFLVILKDKDVHQDPSGRSVEHAFFKKDADGNDVKAVDGDGKFKPAVVASRKIINLRSYHNRVTVNPNGGEAHDAVFDRKIKVKNRGEMYCAVIPNPVHRAMVCFLIDKKGKMRVDKRYLLADPNQRNRLRQVFTGVHYQQMNAERLAQKHFADPGDQDE